MNTLFLSSRSLLLATTCLALSSGMGAQREISITAHGAVPNAEPLATKSIQSAIDAAAAAGGATVNVPAGVFRTGTIHLKDNVRLFLQKGALLQGSKELADYDGQNWESALIQIHKARNVSIEGPGTIDGADLRRPDGEEGFRGFHAIHVRESQNIVMRDFTITRAGNYAILCRETSRTELARVIIRGGHDGLHAQACRNFVVRDCDFRTGDDAIAGCDNHDFEITGCKINSSCNGFRFGCLNLVVRKCEIWGPGEFQHQVSSRNNMLAAFIHFSPTDRQPKYPSDNWLIEDLTVRNVESLYAYDHERGLWQTGQPAKRLTFRKVKATGVSQPLRVLGDKERQLNLTLDQVDLALASDAKKPLMIDATRFGSLTLKDVTLRHPGGAPVVHARDGNIVNLTGVTVVPNVPKPFHLEQIGRALP